MFIGIFYANMKQKIINGYRLTYAEALKLLKTWSDDELFTLANDLREHFLGRKLSTCMIMNAKSGKCTEDCKWCSQSVFHNTDVKVYDFVREEEVWAKANLAENKKVEFFSLVTSGRKLSAKQVKRATQLYRKARQIYPSLNFCASMGLLNKSELQELYSAGVRRYHCNIETAPSLFPTLCSTHTQQQKLKTIKWAKEVGMEVCSGGIIGMGESMKQRIEMAVLLQKLQILSIPINVLIPIKGTALEQAKPLTDKELLQTFALFRIINPEADIRLAGGRVRICHIQDKALQCGVSASMVGNLLTTTAYDIDEDIKHFKELNYEL